MDKNILNKATIGNNKQTQVGFVDMDVKHYKSLVYSFNFMSNKKVDYSSKMIISNKVDYMHEEPISTTDRWHSDVILHSSGGYIESAHIVIELLRNRFNKVNFLIPFVAHSATSMMCMAADRIIMTPEASMSPFDAQILAPDDNKTYMPVFIMKECVQNAKKNITCFIYLRQKAYTKAGIGR